MNRSFLFLLALLFPFAAFADVKLPYLIGDGMVVQRFQEIPIWGWTGANESLVVEFAGERKDVLSDEKGAWSTQFSARKEGGPFVITIKQKKTQTQINDVWVGDVWVCSGQSNMEWLLRDVDNAEQALQSATDTNIRHFKVPNSWSVTAETTLEGGVWQVNSPEVAENFTAVGYFFAKELRRHINVPIGLIHSSWGGSNIESWMTGPLLGMTDKQAVKKLEKILVADTKTKKQTEKKVNQWKGALLNDLNENMATVATADWSGVGVDEKDWIKIYAPLLWESSGFDGLDGVAWYRRSFSLAKDESQHDLTLHLARIDDSDITWVNGVKVGASNVYSHERHYRVSKDILQAGKNVIAIRVDDTGGGGGIYSDSELSLELKNGKKSLSGNWMFKVEKGFVTLATNKNHTATALYNKMMHPLFQVPIKGVLWYQGESNANTPEQALAYRDQFKKLITYWRGQWKNAELPFFWVQLANFKSGRDSDGQSPWALLRESQTKALQLPQTGQAITIDVGNPDDIHPRDKQTVGKRLAMEVLNKVYGQSNIKYRGPVFEGFSVNGNTIVVKITTAGALKIRKPFAQLSGFVVAGSDKIFYPAEARIEEKSLIVFSPKVKQPIAVRYAWEDNPEAANLMDENGLPAEPFRTDAW